MTGTVAPHEADLRYWLANEDWYMSNYTRRWLERTPPDEAGATLAHIAEDAQPEPTSPLSRVLNLVALSGFATSSGITGSGPGSRKAGVRAALLLAGRGDARAIAPLIRVFDPYGFWQSKYETEIETSLTRLIAEAEERGDVVSCVPDIRDLVERLWNAGGERRDLTPTLTDLLLATLSYLRFVGGVDNLSVLQNIADASVTTPNRQKAKSTATALLLA